MRKICYNFLKELDSYIKDNIDNLRCLELHNAYYGFWVDLKKFRGCSSHFHGLSELLIFRTVYHLLGGSFKENRITKDLYDFRREDIRIGQNIPIKCGKESPKLDVAVFKNDKCLAVIESKTYLSEGVKTIDRTIEKFKLLRGSHPDLRALLINFSLSATMESKLEERKNSDWFNYLILKDNNALISEELRKSLRLDRLTVGV